MNFKKFILRRKFLTKEGMENIRNHKYKGGEYTYLDNVMNHYWYWALNFFPRTLAPNAITLIGFLINMSSMLLILFYTTDLGGYIPNWVFHYFTLTLFLYQTFDAVDGKQARRLKLASPLGQLFDHGCDACLAFFLLLTSLFMVKSGEDSYLVKLALNSNILTFYCANWAEYFTGVLKTNNNGMGVTEIQFFFMGLSTITAFFGREIFKTQIFYWDLNKFVLTICVIAAAFCVIPIFIDAYKQTDDKKTFFRMMIPISMILIGINFLICDITEGHMVLAFSIASFACVTNVVKIIVSSMSHMRFKTFHFECYFFLFISIIVRFGSLGGFSLVFVLSLSTLILFCNLMSLVLSIIFQISTELNIKVLTV